MSTVMITGASSGFGEACAEKFSETASVMILIARNIEKLNLLASRLSGRCKIIIAAVDVSSTESVECFFSAHKSSIQDVDVLINSAGLALGLDLAEEADIDDWERMVDTNIKGLLRVTKNALPAMIHRNKGHIINIGSTAGSWPYPGGNVYGGSKAFVKQFSRGLRADLLGKSIRVTNIEPGMAKTNFSNVRFRGDAEQADEVYRGTEPIQAKDVADIIHWVTTQPLHININSLEVMPLCQSWGALSVNRDMELSG